MSDLGQHDAHVRAWRWHSYFGHYDYDAAMAGVRAEAAKMVEEARAQDAICPPWMRRQIRKLYGPEDYLDELIAAGELAHRNDYRRGW